MPVPLLGQHPNDRGGRTLVKPSIRKRRLIGRLLALAGLAVMVGAAPASAQAAGPNLGSVIDALRIWMVGLLAGLATLFLTVGGIRYLLAGGDPSQVERAKQSLRSAAVGYAVAALAPVLVAILRSIIGT